MTLDTPEAPEADATALPSAAESATAKKASPTKLIIVSLVLVALFLLSREVGGAIPILAARIEALGAWGPAAFIVIYALATIAFVPGALLTLAGGALFDLFEGTFYVFIAAVVGSSSAFLIARYAARAFIEDRLRNQPRFAAIDRATGEQGLKIVFLLRLSPVFPFNFMNYALGLTRVRFRDYLLASIGMLPGTLLYVYYGKAIGDVAALAADAAPDKDAAYYGVMTIGLVATIAVTALITRLARRALAEATESNSIA